MHILPVCYTDASYEGGNHTPSELIKAAIKHNYPSIVVHDHETMSATLSAYKKADKSGVGIISAVELRIRDDEYVWLRLWTQHEELMLQCGAPKGPFNEQSLLFINKCRDKDIKSLERKIIELWDNSTFNASFIASDVDGYKALMKISSLQSLRKKKALDQQQEDIASQTSDDDDNDTDSFEDDINAQHDDSDESSSPKVVAAFLPPLTFRDISQYCQNVHVILSASQLESINSQPELTLSWFRKWMHVFYRVAVCPSTNKGMVPLLSQIGVKCIPWMSCRYINDSDYEYFVTKVAVHQDTSIRSPLFVYPSRSERWMTAEQFSAAMSDWLTHAELFDLCFWENIKPIKLDVGRVDLPNVPIDLEKTVNFTYTMFPVENPLHDGDPIVRFDAWIKQRNELKEPLTDSAYYDYRKRRLNDMCLWQLSLEGFDKRMNTLFGNAREHHETTYRERLEMEFKVIESMKFAGYFLILYDVVKRAREMGAPVGPGRGSAAGSLLVYCLEITDIDPIANDLQFERFLNPERVSMPDIDTDIGDGVVAGRKHVLKYISTQYQQKGSEWPSTCQICNVNKYKVKSSISRVRSAFGLSMAYDAYLKKVIQSCQQATGVTDAEFSWDHVLGFEPIKIKMKREPIFSLVLRHAQQLTDKKSSDGIHAGGVVIAPTEITDYSAFALDNQGRLYTQYDKDDIESAGLVKLDLLGLRTLNIIDMAVHTIRRDTGIVVDPRSIPWDDPKVIEYINDLNLVEIFQLGGSGIRGLVKNLKPSSISEIAVLSALFRPGPLQSKMHEDFVSVKFGEKQPYYDHPALKSVTGSTYGCIVYQEQVMSIVRVLAGYSLGGADLLRRAMGKKKVEEMLKHKAQFNNKAVDFWRESMISAGEERKSSIKWDPCLSDMTDVLSTLGLIDCLDSSGYFSDVFKVIPYLANFLSLNPKDTALLSERLDHYMFTSRDFNSEYGDLIKFQIREKLASYDKDRIDEAELRVYYGLSQMVRFNQIFNKIEKFAGYGFNKSHALAYAVVTYISAFIKYYYPVHFYAATFNSRDVDCREEVFYEMQRVHSLELLLPDLNISREVFEPHSSRQVSYGLTKIKSLGKGGTHVVSERALNGPYLGVWSSISRLSNAGVTDSNITKLIYAGAFDSLCSTSLLSRISMHPRNFVEFQLVQFKNLGTKNNPIPTFNHAWIENNAMKATPHEQLCLSLLFLAMRCYMVKPRSGKSVKSLSSLSVSRRKSCVNEGYAAIHEIIQESLNATLSGDMESHRDGVQSLLAWLPDTRNELSVHKAVDVMITKFLNDDQHNDGEPHDLISLMIEKGFDKDGMVKYLSTGHSEYTVGDVKWMGFIELLHDVKAESQAITQWEDQKNYLEKYLPEIIQIPKRDLFHSVGGFWLLTDSALSAVTQWVKSSLTHGVQPKGMLIDMISEIEFITRKGGPVSWVDLVFYQSLIYFKVLQTNVLQQTPESWPTQYKAWSRAVINVCASFNETHSIDLLLREKSALGCYLSNTPSKAIQLELLAEREPAGTYLDGSPIQVNKIDRHLERRDISTFGMVQNVKISTIRYEHSRYFNQKQLHFTLIDDAGYAIACRVSGDRDVALLSNVFKLGALVLMSGEVRFHEKYGLSLNVKAGKRFYPDPMAKVIGI